jgi:membrane associated rhomboid family serine protease
MIPIQNIVASRYPPAATWGLIAVNGIVFLVQIGLSPDELEWFLSHFALIPAAFLDSDSRTLGDYLPLVTNMFLHGGWLHLILNMWILWLFGPSVEDRLGPGRYLLFYLAAGVAASVTHAVFNPTSEVPALGASGAIAGVLGAYLRMFPFARVVVVVPIVIIPFFFEVPAIVFVGLWFLMQLLQGTVELLAPMAGGGVAWWAHVGGFLAGLVLAPVVRRPRRVYRPYYPDEGVLGFTPWGNR